jgi:hypothetical protein
MGGAFCNVVIELQGGTCFSKDLLYDPVKVRNYDLRQSAIAVEKYTDPEVSLREEGDFVPETVDTPPVVPDGSLLVGIPFFILMDPPAIAIV